MGKAQRGLQVREIDSTDFPVFLCRADDNDSGDDAAAQDASTTAGVKLKSRSRQQLAVRKGRCITSTIPW